MLCGDKKKSFSSNKEIKENFDNKIQQSALIAVLHLVDQRDNNHNLLNGKVIKFSNNIHILLIRFHCLNI